MNGGCASIYIYKNPIIMGGSSMIQYNKSAYEAMLGNISENIMEASASCMAQCTGCMCNCRCSCSGGVISDFEWEVM